MSLRYVGTDRNRHQLCFLQLASIRETLSLSYMKAANLTEGSIIIWLVRPLENVAGQS